ncbi:replication protein VP4 [Microviridae Fen7786_21]|uniref:replication protein VP4 n=1 Tax=Microviridae Fen7786_21 TaxID=1655658 RepID=UPI00063D5520|nr:replication protein VP4 [Microviridae Fen7786_21]AKI26932.1 replication protein VP4 [Microviridae Fen7786_21]
MACLFPFYVEKTRTILLKGGGASFKSDRIPVPCGKCPNCLTRRANGWAFRIMHQERVSVSSLWVTLTYDPHSVRITPNGYMTLVKRDVQLFIKRIRKAIHSDWLKKNRLLRKQKRQLLPLPLPVKYYCCGEYGSTYWRPHYHIVLLNVPESTLSRSWYDAETGALMGDVYIDPRPLSESCIAYTVFYCNKGSRVPAHRNDDRAKEFSLMSKGMGLSYLTEHIFGFII